MMALEPALVRTDRLQPGAGVTAIRGAPPPSWARSASPLIVDQTSAAIKRTRSRVPALIIRTAETIVARSSQFWSRS